MKPDSITKRYHVRERDNRAAVILTETSGNTYLSYELLINGEWKHVDGSSIGVRGWGTPDGDLQRFYTSIATTLPWIVKQFLYEQARTGSPDLSLLGQFKLRYKCKLEENEPTIEL